MSIPNDYFSIQLLMLIVYLAGMLFLAPIFGLWYESDPIIHIKTMDGKIISGVLIKQLDNAYDVLLKNKTKVRVPESKVVLVIESLENKTRNEKEIHKKIWPPYFEKVVSGEKKHEIRLADFECKPGDVLVLEEWDPKTKQYTGRSIRKKVTYVGKTKNLDFWPKEDVEKYGYQIFSLSEE
jgi:ribosomal protein S17